MTKEDIKNGSLVVIKHSREGGEIVDDNRPDGRVLVKVARMKLLPLVSKSRLLMFLQTWMIWNQ